MERELRDSRPVPHEDFVAALADAVAQKQRRRGARVAVAVAIVLSGIAALGAFGGLGYAANAVGSTLTSAKETITLSSQPKLDISSPAHDQYGAPFHGCTPGYWKQSQHFFRWGGISTSTSFNATFTVTAAQSGFANSYSLLDALKQGGGGIAALGRQAVAAYLNSHTPGMNFPYSTAQVVQLVHDAIVGGDAKTIESTKDRLEQANSLEGPLC